MALIDAYNHLHMTKVLLDIVCIFFLVTSRGKIQ